MSIKLELKGYLQGAEKTTINLRKKLKSICENSAYSEEGKKQECNNILDKHYQYIDALKEQVSKTVEEKITSMDFENEKELAKRNKDKNYQSILLYNLKMLPLMKDGVSAEELKKRLSIFQDDPFAISALKSALSECSGMDRMLYISCIPEDTRANKKARLSDIGNTICGLLDRMKIEIKERAFENGFSIERDIARTPYVYATLDYLDACNDDCTVYDANKHAISNTPRETITNFNFGFTHAD